MADHSRSSRILRLAIVAGALVLLSLAWAGCGDSDTSQEELDAARQQGAAKARQEYKIRQIQKELKALRKRGGGSGSTGVPAGTAPAPEGGSSSGSSGSGNCGGSLSANEVTTCGFAEAVEDAYYAEIGSGAGTVIAYSPTTEQSYSMYCTAGSPHECTGGNNAAVYFP